MCVCVLSLTMFYMICSLLFCYTVCDLETNSTCQHQLSIDNAFDLFDEMNMSHIEPQFVAKQKKEGLTLHVLGRNANYTVIILPSTDKNKRMVVFNGVLKAATHQACYHSKLATPWMTISIIYLIIVIFSFLAINICLRRVKPLQQLTATPKWERFSSTLRRFNTAPQNDSS